MISDLSLALACMDSYRPDSVWDHCWQTDGVWVAHRRGDEDVVVFRGSENVEDWLRDFRAIPLFDPSVGICHLGFLEGMRSALVEINLELGTRRPWITGHSLGAARALILAGMMAAAGISPAGVVTFGTPRPGFKRLTNILEEGGFPVRLYKNKGDPVTEVPWLMGMYVKPEEIEFDVEPESNRPELLRKHHMALYAEGVRRLQGALA